MAKSIPHYLVTAMTISKTFFITLLAPTTAGQISTTLLHHHHRDHSSDEYVFLKNIWIFLDWLDLRRKIADGAIYSYLTGINFGRSFVSTHLEDPCQYGGIHNLKHLKHLRLSWPSKLTYIWIGRLILLQTL